MGRKRKHIQVQYEGVDFEVYGRYVPPVPGGAYASNGDPGHPDEGAYIDGFDVRLGGYSLNEVLSLAALEGIEAKACEAAGGT